jgi:hypothetical protein
VKAAVLYLVHGEPADENSRSIGLVEAARLAGLQADQLRRWLDRSQVKSFLRAERKIALEGLCASNPAALGVVRDRSKNPMAAVGAVKQLEDMRAAENGGHAGAFGGATPGITIVIGTMRTDEPPVTIDGRSISAPYVTLPREPEAMPPDLDPVFRAPGDEPRR